MTTEFARQPLRIWCNLRLPDAALARLQAGLRPHVLVMANRLSPANSPLGAEDAALGDADIAFGQPEAAQAIKLRRLRWVHLSSAGYTSFDTPAVKGAFAGRGAHLSTSSKVFNEPCAQHVLAFMMADARQLPRSVREQDGSRAWTTLPTRAASRLLRGGRVVIAGWGTIARRLNQILSPFGVEVIGIRRHVRGDEETAVYPIDELSTWVRGANHVINVLPANDQSRGVFGAAIFAAMMKGAVFYNIGRGVTVDQDALVAALNSGHLRGAYLDVTDPEPLPATHPLWTAANCFITPHVAGGYLGEHEDLVEHFLDNFARHLRDEPLHDQII